jgi:DNA primase
MAADSRWNFPLDELNEAFDGEQWLRENYGCEFFPASNGWLNTCCPFEDHTDSSPSFGIKNEEGRFNCFGCARTGDFISLISKLCYLNFHQAVNLMAEYCGFDINNIDSLQYKVDKFKKTLNEENQEYLKNKKIILKATYYIKKIQKQDFEKAEKLYENLDKLVKEEQYNLIERYIYGTT